MSLKIRLILFLFCLNLIMPLYGQSGLPRQTRKANAAPEEIVSFSRSTSFSMALSIINDLSIKYLGKVIIGRDLIDAPIGVNINNKHWRTALELILRNNELWYDEFSDYLKIVPLGAEKSLASQSILKTETVDLYKTREVVISAVFFEADVSKLRQAGMSWNFIRRRGVNLGVRNTSVSSKSGLLEIDIKPNLDFGDVFAILKGLENDQVGEIINSPQITVKSGKTGKIQVGKDIAITLQDFSGNAVTQFFSTGSIIKVDPIVIVRDSVIFINIDLKIERSSSSTGESGLEIQKSLAETSVLLLDGEETVIGGLYINEETKVRSGIPFLKNLPWWFFGLRYVFGSESVSYLKKELLILIKSELLPSLEDRLQAKLNGVQKKDLLRQERRRQQLQMQFNKKQLQKK